MFTRRNFLKKGVATASLSAIGGISAIAEDCPFKSLSAPGPIPLNNILVDYQQEQFRGYGLKKVTICDKDSWESKRLNIMKRAELVIGHGPAPDNKPFNAEMLAETQREGYLEKKLQFPSGTGDTINGYLLVPDGTSISSPRPAILGLHGTRKEGCRILIGHVPDYPRIHAKDLAQRGYVVLVVDVITGGERIYPDYGSYDTTEFYKKFPDWSAMGKMVADHQRALDYLCSLDIVDGERLGCIGHSLGGYNSFFLNAFEPRIKAAVVSCGLSPMGGSNTPYQFARNTWFVHLNLICREYIRAGMIPCDFHEIMALGAPTPMFNYSGMKDATYFPLIANKEEDFAAWWKTVDEALTQIAGVYKTLGVPGNFERVENDEGHGFPDEIMQKAYKFLDKHLGRA